jgi:hypothetical protein
MLGCLPSIMVLRVLPFMLFLTFMGDTFNWSKNVSRQKQLKVQPDQTLFYL